MKYIELTEDEIANIHHLDFTDVAVLNAACRTLQIDLRRTQRPEERWYVTPKDAPASQALLLIEAAAFVRGYGMAWLRGRAKAKSLAKRVFEHFEDKLETW